MIKMVQILPRIPTFGERIGAGLGAGLSEAFSKIPEYLTEKKKQEEEFRKMAKENEALKRFGIDLTDISSPQARSQAIGLALQGKTPEQMQKQEADLLPKMRSFADQLEASNPQSPQHKLVADIYRSELPSDEKSSLVKTLTGIDPYKMEQQNRLQRDSLLKYYNQKIKETDNDIKNARYSDRATLQDQKRTLQAERDRILDFKALVGDADEKEEEFETGVEEEEEEEKVKFNPKNPKHVAVFKKLDKQFKRDRQKVNKALAKAFKL